MSHAALQPTISTTRLVLRPFGPDDVAALVRIGAVMENGVDPLVLADEAAALAFVQGQEALYSTHKGVMFAVEEVATGALCGFVGLRCDFENRNAALLFGTFAEWEGRGYATEALRCVIGYSFGYFRISRVHAEHLASNRGAARVLGKIGLPQEGVRREHCFRPGMGPQDLIEYGMLLHEWAEVAHAAP